MINNIDPVLLSIGPLKVYYYGVIYMIGFLLGYFFLLLMVKKEILPSKLKKIDIENYVFFVVIWTIIGSRLFEVFFYSGDFFLKNPLKIFALWEGGLSFHGGVVAFFFYTLHFTRKKQIHTLQFLDICSIPAAFALFMGRIANFINSELYGLPVENQVSPPWYAVLFQRTDPQQLYRFPVQLFESFGNLIVFFILTTFACFFFKKKKNWPYGLIGFSFLFFYAIFRFIIEYIKDYARDSFFGLTVGQLLTIPMILIGIVGMIYSIKNHNKKSMS